MKRTIFSDGIEVDASDLNNTEETKIDEILETRRGLSRFGVIEGLELVNIGNTITIKVGKTSFANGEIVSVDTPITGITGASFDAGVSNFVGIRLGEVTSNPKPHEVDPITIDTRASDKIVGELFIAADNSDGARQTALDAAKSAELNDGNFVLLGEFKGTGVGLEINPVHPTPLPVSKGGEQPNFGASKPLSVRTGLKNLYDRSENNEFPIHSSEDNYHRSLVGTGIPGPGNPHAQTLNDLGGEQELVAHRIDSHTNGIIGLEPADDDFTPATGTFSFSLVDPGNLLIVHPIAPGDAVIINGRKFTNLDVSADTTIDFSAAVAGYHYVIAKYATGDGNLSLIRMDKATFDALCPLDNGTPTWLNNAVQSGEKRFVAIGLVRRGGGGTWDPITSPIVIPAGGDLSYRTQPPPGLALPASQKTLDLRRFGTITTENVQKRTIRLDRLTEPVASTLDLYVHKFGFGAMTADINDGGIAAPGPNNTIPKHITDFNADKLFGHKGAIGITQHGASLQSSGNPPAGFPGFTPTGLSPVPDQFERYGFQSPYDKWKQDNLTMTIFKWSDLRNLSGSQGQDSSVEVAIGDAVGVSSGNPAADPGAGGYGTIRTGYLTNFCMSLRRRPASNARSLTISIITSPVGGASTQTIISVPVISGASGDPTTDIFRFNNQVIGVGASVSTPWRIQCVRLKDNGNTEWRDLTVTAEFHYFY